MNATIETIRSAAEGCYAQQPYVRGLYLMGSRALGDPYQWGDHSDLDCCVVVSKPLDYDVLHAPLSSAVPNLKCELCPRTEAQILHKNKFNFDLKYLSKGLLPRHPDPRDAIPEIHVSDWPRKDTDRILLSCFGFLAEAISLATVANTEPLLLAVASEKVYRRLTLYLSLRARAYPVPPDRLARIGDRYPNHIETLAPFSSLRHSPVIDERQIGPALAALFDIAWAEITCLADEYGPHVTHPELVGMLSDPETTLFTTQNLALFAALAERRKANGDNFPHLQQPALEWFAAGYGELISSAGEPEFCPPQVVDGVYHVFQ